MPHQESTRVFLFLSVVLMFGVALLFSSFTIWSIYLGLIGLFLTILGMVGLKKIHV